MVKTLERKSKLYLAAFTVLFVVMFTVSFNIGKYPISPGDLVHVLWGKLTGAPKDWTNQMESIIFHVRMPRILSGTLIGAGLSAAGAAYQGIFRNPMVSPDMLGATAGAGFGASISMLLGLSYFMVSINAFIFGVLSVAIAYLISTRARQNPTLGLVLAGIMVKELFTAGTSFIKLLADPTNILPSITYWLMGSLAAVRGQDIVLAGIPIVLGLTTLYVLRWKINLLTMGEDEARSMGVNTRLLRLLIIASATLITAACISIGGMIGWVGLVIPHFSRMLVGYDYRVMLPASMLMGASFLLLVDNFARMLASAEIPLGILTAFIGAPFFLYLILSRGNET